MPPVQLLSLTSCLVSKFSVETTDTLFSGRASLMKPVLRVLVALREPRIATTLVGVRDPQHLEADVAAVSEAIPEDIWQKLHERFGI